MIHAFLFSIHVGGVNLKNKIRIVLRYRKSKENALRDVMRYLIIALSCATLLAGCQSSSHLEKNSGELTATLPKVDVDKEPGLLDQYRLGASL